MESAGIHVEPLRARLGVGPDELLVTNIGTVL
jgi:hypothetical protein